MHRMRPAARRRALLFGEALCDRANAPIIVHRSLVEGGRFGAQLRRRAKRCTITAALASILGYAQVVLGARH